MKTMITVTARNSQRQLGAFDTSTSNIERLFDAIVKYDCYGVGEDMIKRLGDLQNFFCDSEEGSPAQRVFLSNNALMVVFNILSELLTQNMSNMRMTHSRIMYKRKTNKDDRTIGANLRADVIYKDTAIMQEFMSMVTTAIYEGEALIITEEEVE